MSASSGTTLAILAGGRGTRMGGPKHQLRIGGLPACEYLLKQLAWPGPTMLVLAQSGEVPSGAELYGKIVHDEGDGSGPLRSVATAVEQAVTESTVVLPIDMPCIDRGQLSWLVDALEQRRDAAGIMLSRECEGSLRVEPFPSVFRRCAAALLRSELRKGKLAVRHIAEGGRVQTLRVQWPQTAWMNLNTPGDLPEWVTMHDGV